MYSGLKNVFKEIEKESKNRGKAEERLNSSRYFKEQMELAGLDPVKVEEILKGFENAK